MARKITALQVQKHNNQRVNIYLDGEFAFGLARILAAWLNIGQELSSEKIAQLQADDERETAFQRALKFLSHRNRTEAEIRAQLAHHGVLPELVDETVSRLNESGLIDDRRFASQWIENRAEFRPRGRRALAYELKQKGIAQDAIAEALEDLDEDELAYQSALKYLKKLAALNWLDFRKKMYAHLARRGFSYTTIAAAVHRVWSEIQNDTQTEDETQFEEVEK